MYSFNSMCRKMILERSSAIFVIFERTSEQKIFVVREMDTKAEKSRGSNIVDIRSPCFTLQALNF